MKKLLLSCLSSAIVAATVLIPITGNAALPILTQENNKILNNTTSLAPMLERVLPAVVNITIIGEINSYDLFANSEVNDNGDEDQGDNQTIPKNNANQGHRGKSPVNPGIHGRKFESQGSGVIIDAQKGYVLTNAHLLRHAKIVTVALNDGRLRRAKMIGMDLPSDVAVLQIEADKLVALPMAPENSLKVGDFVVAIGNPFGLNESVTSGIVSALQRTGLGIEGYENFIQTDAPINPGNSGGALIDLNGRLVGINTAILAPSGGNVGIGFAIPIDMANSVMKQLIEYGSVRRGLIGVMIQNLTPGLAHAFELTNVLGAVVTQVNPLSPAAKAGIQVGDVIQNVNNKQVTNASQVTNIIGLLRVGSTVNLDLLRNGKLIKLNVTTTAPQEYQKQSMLENPFLYGIDLRNFNQVVGGYGSIQGVQVVDIAEESPALHATPVGLRPGDVIVSANKQPIRNLEDLINISKKNNTQLLLNILREDGALFVVIK